MRPVVPRPYPKFHDTSNASRPGRISRDRWIFPRRRWPWNSSFHGRHASARNFRAQAGWSTRLGTGNRYRRLQRSNLEASISRVILNADERRAVASRLLVKRGSACRSKAPRPRPSPRSCRRGGKPLFATPTGFSSPARRTSISSTGSIGRRPCDGGFSEAVEAAIDTTSSTLAWPPPSYELGLVASACVSRVRLGCRCGAFLNVL